MICGWQFVLLKEMSDCKVLYVGWVGGVGEDDTTDNLGRGGVDFLQLVHIVYGYPSFQYLFRLDEIGRGIDEVIEWEEGIFVFWVVFSVRSEWPFIIIIDNKSLFGAGHIIDFQGDFDIMFHPWLLEDNGADVVIIWLSIDVGYTLRLNLHDIYPGASLNCDGFSVVPGVD